jgi:hypothetical protein
MLLICCCANRAAESEVSEGSQQLGCAGERALLLLQSLLQHRRITHSGLQGDEFVVLASSDDAAGGAEVAPKSRKLESRRSRGGSLPASCAGRACCGSTRTLQHLCQVDHRSAGWTSCLEKSSGCHVLGVLSARIAGLNGMCSGQSAIAAKHGVGSCRGLGRRRRSCSSSPPSCLL